jgi:hypothetical protein
VVSVYPTNRTIVSDLRFLLEIKAIQPETSPFLSAQMAVLSSFFQMFIVLGMYNFAYLVKKARKVNKQKFCRKNSRFVLVVPI